MGNFNDWETTPWNGGRPDILADLLRDVWNGVEEPRPNGVRTWSVIAVQNELQERQHVGPPTFTVRHTESDMLFTIKIEAL